MNGIICKKDAENIVTMTMDLPGPVNAMNDEFSKEYSSTIERLEKEKDDIAGVILTSAKNIFFAGADLKVMVNQKKENVDTIFSNLEKIKSYMRRLELLGKPVVAAINGTALGAGLELCLACHHRIAVNDPKLQLGFPEVTLGILPGAGGTVRTIRMLGLEKGLPSLLQGKRFNPENALASGFIDELAKDNNDMVAKAGTWIKANPEAVQPWDQKGYKIPGGGARHPKVLQTLAMMPGILKKQTRGLLPAPEAILATAAESMIVDFDTALRIESRKFAGLAITAESKNLITTTFLELNKLKAGGSRPKEIEKSKVKKVAILGAGMMGQGIAYVSAMVGIEVILKDMTLEAAQKGKAYSDMLLSKRMAKGKMDEAKKAAILNLITPTADNKDLKGCDLIVEAVFENIELKDKVTKETEPLLIENGVFGSNTSTLPITELAKASSKPENFIGIHFFSPVDRMPLVEIITGEKTSPETLAKTFDYVQQIRKVPIVVNDSRGFFTSRVFSTFVDEGAALLNEGIDPALIENLAYQTGMPVGPLAISDEISQQTMLTIGETNQKLDELRGEDTMSRAVAGDVPVRMATELDRKGKVYGKGYYEYPEKGKKYLWPELYEIFHNPDVNISHQDIKDRFIFRMIMESLRCLEDGVFNAVRDGNIGSLMGFGFPAHTGGVFQHINTYGAKKFAQRASELAQKYGDRFEPPKVLLEKAEQDELFMD